MPLLAGEPLDARLKGRQPLPVADVLLFGRQTAEGLAAAHAAGLIHRDIKPSNIWLERHPDGAFKRVRILDFGLAKAQSAADGELTHSGAILGTPAYMAPEQARGEKVDSRADLFSLGCVLHEMATGMRPFGGHDVFSMLTALATETPASPASVNPALPPALSDLIVRLLSKDPAARPPSAKDVAAELGRINREGEAPAVPRSPGLHGSAGASPSRGRRRSRRSLWVVAGVLFLALAAVGAYQGKTIVRVANNEGELVVEVDDPNVEVVVKGMTVEILDPKGKRYLVSAGKDGEVEIREKGTDSVLVTEKFRVKRGDKVVVSVSNDRVVAARKKDGVKPKEMVLPTDERKAAEWVLKQGGRIDGTFGGKKLGLGLGDAIPDGPFTVKNVLLYLDHVNDDDLENLRALPPIKEHLYLSNTAISDKGLEKIASFPSITPIWQLNINGTRITDAGLANLKHFPNLYYLDLSGTSVSSKGLDQLKSPPLSHLFLDGCKSVDNEAVAQLVLV